VQSVTLLIIGSSAYRLRLPPLMKRIHPVFNVIKLTMHPSFPSMTLSIHQPPSALPYIRPLPLVGNGLNIFFYSLLLFISALLFIISANSIVSIYISSHLSCQRVDSPGIKLNIKVAIFNSHLAPIYYKRVKQYDYMWLSGNRSDKVCKMYKYRMDT
jgi:hypothetical protein